MHSEKTHYVSGPWGAVEAKTKAYCETKRGGGGQRTQEEFSSHHRGHEAIRDFEERTHMKILGLIRQYN